MYEYLPGWDGDISGAQALSDLPANARAYVRFLEAQAQLPDLRDRVGQDRAETIVVHDLID